ncbi:MAG: ArsR/SmtB family transcription factor [Agrobacterium tumefaciens]
MLVETRPVNLQAKLFRGFSDPSRLSILEVLRGGPASVSDIVAVTGLSQPNASNHLRCLAECGLVLGEQQGRFVRYRLSDPRIDKLMALSDELVAGPARLVNSRAESWCARMNGGGQRSRS